MAKSIWLKTTDREDWPVGRRIKVIEVGRGDRLWEKMFPNIAAQVMNAPATIIQKGQIEMDDPIDSGARRVSLDEISNPVHMPNGNIGSRNFFLIDILVEFIDDPDENY